MQQYDAVILAGGRAPWLKELCGTELRCLAPLNGRRMVDYISEALLASGRVRRIVLAANADALPELAAALPPQVSLCEAAGDMPSTAAAAVNSLGKDCSENIIFACDDIPLLTAAGVQHELEQIAAQLGSDIPFCIEGGTMLATGRGEVLTKLADLPQALVVLAKPKGLEVSTAWVYQHYNRGRVVHSPCIWQLQDRLAEGAPALVPYMGNVLETVTIPAHPIIASIKAAMLSAGAYYALMSGSGPTVFAFARDEQTAEQIVAALADFEVETAITTTVGRIY